VSGVRRWPLFVIASPAAVAVWSGWVGLGSLCGFGMVHPLPGILPGFQLNTAITLPVGVEAYGAYALGAWLTPGVPETARTFARRSAIGALLLGMAGQVIYHLLAAGHATRAPVPVVVLVSCLPVVSLGFGAALAHLLRQPGTPEETDEAVPETMPGTITQTPEPAPVTAPSAPEALPRSRSRTRGIHRAPEVVFAQELAAGELPSIRMIKRKAKVGQDKAVVIRNQLADLVSAPRETIDVPA
jgi:hypothetical protein